jgi:hypothetical protein
LIYNLTEIIIDSICEFSKVNQNIKHLVLRISQLNDILFKNINLFLPQLKQLKIHSYDSISDKTMHRLAKMPKLLVIDLILFKPKPKN